MSNGQLMASAMASCPRGGELVVGGSAVKKLKDVMVKAQAIILERQELPHLPIVFPGISPMAGFLTPFCFIFLFSLFSGLLRDGIK